MEEEKDIKSIKISLPYVTVDGKNMLREMSVSFKSVKEEQKGNYHNDYSPVYSMKMSITIPDHIHEKLKGAIVGRKTELNDNGNTEYKSDFSKTLSRSSLRALTEDYRDIIYDYKWIIHRENLDLTKVIFYSFDGNNVENYTSNWDRKLMGNHSEISYSYMIGFVSKDKKVKLNSDKKEFGQRDGSEHKWKYIEHTDAREEFFKSVFSKFIDLYQQLQDFEKIITPKSLDEMIKSGIKLIG